VTDEPKCHFLTIEQAADELNVRSSLIRNLIKAGELRAIQVGACGVWGIGIHDVEDYIAEAYRRTEASIAAGDIEDSGGTGDQP
jgi:excisionase family DNA binding protein